MPTSLGIGARFLPFLRAFLGLAWLSLALARPGSAHLAMIRMGQESAGILQSNDRTGSALAAGDFNGDGYDDLAIGAPGKTVNGIAGAGAVVVVYGSQYGLTHVGGVLRTAASLGASTVINANFGAALASGNFNGDAYADLAIGAPLETEGGMTNAGRVYVLHGGLGGLEAVADTILTQAVGGDLVEVGDKFGAALTAGDFNGDGDDDLAVGSTGEDANAGAVFQFPGSANGVTRVGAGVFRQADLGGSNTSGDQFGFALTAGNMTGDSKEDLAASAPNRTVGVTLAGVVYLLPGTAAGLAGAGSHSYSAGDVDDAQQAGQFGYALCAGQFGADTHLFLAIGEPGRDVSGLSSGGRVISVRGGADGLDWSVGHHRIFTQAGSGSSNPEPQRFGSALAAGDRWSAADNDFGVDGYDELAVGTLHDLEDRGLVQILHASSTNVTGIGAENYGQTQLGDDAEFDDKLGASLALGHFDDSGLANLAAGAPGEDTSNDLKYDDFGVDFEEYLNAGCVFINAPWRQVLNLKSRGTVVYNCLFDLVYSQRPFDRVRPASTTKIMTLMLACERMDSAHPDYVDSSTSYQVPFWVQEVGGSTAGLYFCENMRFMDLARACQAVSGNDAAHAVADILEPSLPPGHLTNFVNLMNARASLIGMPDTHFSNPAGLDVPPDTLVPANERDNHTTPVGMAILAREAMFNPIYRGLVAVEDWDMIRDIPNDLFLNCEDVTVRRNDPWTYRNVFIAGLRRVLPEISGVKPGGTDLALNTRVLSAEQDIGRVIVARFGIPNGVAKTAEDTALLALGARRCGPPFVWSPPDNPFEGPYFGHDDVGTGDGHRQGGTASYHGGDSETTQVSVYHRAGPGPASLELTLARSSDATLPPQGTAAFAAASFQKHTGLRFANPDTFSVPLRVTTTHPPRDTVVVLPGHGSVTLPAVAATGGAPFLLTLQNLGQSSAHVGVEEMGYAYEITVGGTGGSFSTLLQVGGSVSQKTLSFSSLGHDPNPGNTVLIMAFSPESSPISVEAPRARGGAWPVSLASPPWPNPFLEKVHLVFEVARAGTARMAVYDIRGRQVWARAAKFKAPGRWQAEWGGSGPMGPAPSGVYFFRSWLDDRPGQGGKFALLSK